MKTLHQNITSAYLRGQRIAAELDPARNTTHPQAIVTPARIGWETGRNHHRKPANSIGLVGFVAFLVGFASAIGLIAGMMLR